MKGPMPQGMTPENFRKRWSAAATAIYEVMLDEAYPESTNASRGDHRRVLSMNLNRIAEVMRRDADWRWRTPGASWRLSEVKTPNVGTMVFGMGETSKAIRLAHAVASNEGCAATAGEIDLVRRALANHPQLEQGALKIRAPRAPAPEILSAGQTGVFDAAFAWRTTGKTGRETRDIARGAVQIAVHGVAAADAEVAFRIRTPGGLMEVRNVDGRLYRPLMAPGTWNPVDLATFRETLAEGRAWADHPGIGRYEANRYFDLDDFASEAVIENGRTERSRETYATRMREACAGLICIDGVVYAPADAVKIGLGSYSMQAVVSVTWCIGSLTPKMAQIPLALQEDHTSALFALTGHSNQLPPIAFRPAFQNFVAAMAEDLAERSGRPARLLDSPFEGVAPASRREVAEAAVWIARQINQNFEDIAIARLPFVLDEIEARIAKDNLDEVAEIMGTLAQQRYEREPQYYNAMDFKTDVVFSAFGAAAQILDRVPEDIPDADDIAEAFSP